MSYLLGWWGCWYTAGDWADPEGLFSQPMVTMHQSSRTIKDNMHDHVTMVLELRNQGWIWRISMMGIPRAMFWSTAMERKMQKIHAIINGRQQGSNPKWNKIPVTPRYFSMLSFSMNLLSCRLNLCNYTCLVVRITWLGYQDPLSVWKGGGLVDDEMRFEIVDTILIHLGDVPF